MSVEDLKQRLATVPGIQNLTMRLEGGKEVYSVGAGFVSVEPLASEAELEAAIRTVAPATQLPIVNIADPTPSKAIPAMTINPSSAVSKIEEMMQRHMQKMEDIHNAQLAILQSNLDQQAETLTQGVSAVSSKIAGQTDDFKAMMGRFTNGLGV